MDQVFDSPNSLGSEGPSGQRGASRDSLMLFATLRVPGRDDVTVRIRNLSAGGMMAVHGGPVAADDAVEVEVGRIGWISGRIAWATGGRIGIEFDRAIDPLAARRRVDEGG